MDEHLIILQDKEKIHTARAIQAYLNQQGKGNENVWLSLYWGQGQDFRLTFRKNLHQKQVDRQRNKQKTKKEIRMIT